MLTIAILAASIARVDVPLDTVAESSAWQATALYDQVVKLTDRLAQASPNAARLSLGRSVEGRDLPLLILSNPPVSTPEEAKRLAKERGKLIVMAIGNIHAGEVDGKEALPMLARRIIREGRADLLEHLIIAIAPIYNADGNEHVSLDSRPGQNGPPLGQGRRENSAGMDLNRDFIKAECPETQGLLSFFAAWDPHLFIDTHTTDGSFHRYLITYRGPKNPAGDAPIIRFSRDTMFPTLSAVFARAGKGEASWYGNFEDEFEQAPLAPRTHSRWEDFPAEGRYGTNYYGLRNRLSILSEGYSYAPYRDRVMGTLAFVEAALDFASRERVQISTLLAEADERTIAAGNAPGEDDRVPVRSTMESSGKITIKGFSERIERGRSVPGDELVDYTCEHFDLPKAVVSVKRPWGYYIPAECKSVRDALVRHGIEVSQVGPEFSAPAEKYIVESVRQASRRFQDHVLATVTVRTQAVDRFTAPGGGWLVRTGQKLGNLVVYMLEPAGEDSLATWNYLDPWLHEGQELPVARLPRPIEPAP